MQLYLLEISELIYGVDDDAERAIRTIQLRQDAIQKLDGHRRKKAASINAEMAQNQSIGAGLLLQYAVQTRAQNIEEVVVLSVSEILDKIGSSVDIDYVYDVHGKPDFADADRHFNLSHSGEYVCLVTDASPVGVDIQQMRPLKSYHLAERCFSKKELAKLEACTNETEKVECFYDIWVKKEAYAKLTGEGIGLTVKLDTEDAGLSVNWRMFEAPEGYRLAVCSNLSHKNEM